MISRIASLLEAPLVVADSLATLDAIIVLGAPLAPGGALSPILEERVVAAAALWHAKAAPLVVATGGVTPPCHRGWWRRAKRDGTSAPRAEADALAEGLRAAGVPDVLVERESRTTAENARFVATLLAQRDVRSVWLVTQPFHGRRAARLFRAAGFAPRVWHIADSMQYRNRRRALRWLVREYAAWAKLLVGR